MTRFRLVQGTKRRQDGTTCCKERTSRSSSYDGAFPERIDGRVVACLYCGNGYYLENKEEVTRKLVAMVNKLQPDVVMCGPAFNYADYAGMAAHIATEINANTSVPAFAAMSVENEATINEYKDKVMIVKTPKKGGTGLNEAFEKHVYTCKSTA